MLVHEFLEHSAEKTPDKVGLVCGEDRLTYAEIESRANRLAQALIDQGFQRGERAVLFLPNSPELVIGIFGILKAGGVFVVVHPSTKPEKLEYILQNCGARVLFAETQQNTLCRTLLAKISTLKLAILSNFPTGELMPQGIMVLPAILKRYPAIRPKKTNIDLDLACLIYTSGSTGEPKGVMSDHSNVDFATGSIIQYLENTPDDIVINTLPLSFDYGLYQLLMVMKFGGRLVLERWFAFPAVILNRIGMEHVTGFPGVPTIFALLLQMDLKRFNLSSLRYITNTAAALPSSHVEAIREAFPWVKMYSMYGLTETKRTLYLPPDELAHRPASVGIPIPGTEAWLIDEQGQRIGPGDIGELVVRGRHVMRGYWNDPVATAERFRPGETPGERICYTGDLFRMDDEGYFYFVSRKDDIIKCRGEKVSPREIENVLYQMPSVREAAVIGVPDAVMGQSIKAFVAVNDPKITEADVLRHCRLHLEDLLMPQKVVIVPGLPKTDSGKISKKDLS
jgi:long-chain acyl-CoA synthetase